MDGGDADSGDEDQGEGEEEEPGDEDIGIEEDDQEVEEGQESKGLPYTCRPCQAEVDTHNRTHIPFRSWCEICVQARAENYPHRKVPEEERGVNTLYMDYFYLKDKKDLKDKEKARPSIVLKCRDKKFVTSNMLKGKGQDP